MWKIYDHYSYSQSLQSKRRALSIVIQVGIAFGIQILPKNQPHYETIALNLY